MLIGNKWWWLARLLPGWHIHMKKSKERKDYEKGDCFTFRSGAVLVWLTGNSFAKGTFGNDINSFCDSDPYTGDCLLCHASDSKATPTPAKDAYNAGDYCYYFAADAVCGAGPVDADGDGYDNTVDCNDNDAAVNPGATEIACDGIDQNCDGYDSTVDCNDNDAAINPGAAEICDDAKDNDCNGMIDLQDPVCGIITCTDADADGYSIEGLDCGAIDCNDADANINPSACDIKGDGIDQDCSGKDRLKGKSCPGSVVITCGDFGDSATCLDNGCRWSAKKLTCN